jgi:ubiquinone/menaquinone biosynthesis C-methylase UbiE
VPLDELAVLEAPDREEWQQPERIMDALGIADGARVADVGAGSGWFTVRLARRVGPNGRVYAADIDPAWTAYLSRRLQREGLTNVEPITGTPHDPRLPGGLDAVLLVNTFWQLPEPEIVLGAIAGALAPQGRLGIVDFREDGGGGPGPPRELRVSFDTAAQAAQAAGLRLVSRGDFLRYQFLAIFERPPASTPAAESPRPPRS